MSFCICNIGSTNERTFNVCLYLIEFAKYDHLQLCHFPTDDIIPFFSVCMDHIFFISTSADDTPMLVPQLSFHEQRYSKVGGVLVLFLLL